MATALEPTRRGLALGRFAFGVAFAALCPGASFGVQDAPTAVARSEATILVRVDSLGTERPLPDVPVWAGRREGLSPSFFRKPIEVEEAYRRMDGVGPLARTDANGAAELRVPSGVELFVVAACPRGELRRLAPLAAGERRTLRFALWLGPFRYQGLVRDRESGAPVAGARVEGLGYDLGTSDLRLQVETRTDAAGGYVLREALASVRLGAPGFGPALAALVLGHASPEHPLVTWLDRGAALRGRVLALDGRALAGVPVRCAVERDALRRPETVPEDLQGGRGAFTWDATTDEEGRFELGELPARAWLRIEVPEPGPWSELASLAPGEVRELAIVPEARVTLSGVARSPDGTPIADLPLRARRFGLAADAPPEVFARSAADGRFRFPDCMPGIWFLGPAPGAETLGFAPLERRVELRTGPPEQELVLFLERGLFLRGRVLGDEALGHHRWVGACVEARSAAGVLVASTTAGEGGRFSIGPLAEGPYVLRASLDGFFPLEGLETRALAEDVELHLPPSAGSIAVGVKDEPHVFPRVLLVPEGRPELAHEGSFAIHDACCTFESLEAGLFDAVVTTSDRRLGRVPGLAPTPSGTFVEVELRPCATLRFVFTGPELFARVLVRQGESVVASTLATQGAACGLFVPPGPVRLEVFPLRSRDDAPRGAPLLRELTATLDAEPEVLVP